VDPQHLLFAADAEARDAFRTCWRRSAGSITPAARPRCSAPTRSSRRPPISPARSASSWTSPSNALVVNNRVSNFTNCYFHDPTTKYRDNLAHACGTAYTNGIDAGGNN